VIDRALDPVLMERARAALEATLAHSRALGWAGHNKHDGLNSPLLAATLGWSRLTRLAAIQLVTRAPVNPRPLLGVPRTRNPKGIGLFAHALLDAGRPDEARELLDWLLANPSGPGGPGVPPGGFRGLSWGYPYPWQDVGFFAPRNYPNRVVTCWIGFAFAEAVRVLGEVRYREALPQIVEFLLEEPRVLHESDEELCLSYVPDPSVGWAVMDVPALVGAFLAEAAEVGAAADPAALRSTAARLVRWVVRRQTGEGAWFYTDPPGDSHIGHDNYHTAIVLDCLDRYRAATGDEEFDPAYRRGLAFYRDRLFTRDWAPRWMSDREYPYDIHGAASAILCFTRAARRDPVWWEPAEGVLRWTLDRMYDPRGFFYYQRMRWGTKRFLLLRWANAWMARALASVTAGGGVVSTGIDEVRRFWEGHVNNEYYTGHDRGTPEYFAQIEERRYRYHYHLPPLFDRLAEGAAELELLEIGCGIGIDTLALARRGFREVVGVDLTEVAIEVATGRAEREGLSNVRFRVADAESLPFGDGSFDRVYSFGVLHHTPDVERAVAEVHRVLAPGGSAHVMLYHARSLVGWVHETFRLPYESPRDLRDHCPVVHRFTRAGARELFGAFDRVRVSSEYPFTYGMRALSRLVPRPVERRLGRSIGWHLMIEASKGPRP
jgi:SAM-dependent methyltransferase